MNKSLPIPFIFFPFKDAMIFEICDAFYYQVKIWIIIIIIIF